MSTEGARVAARRYQTKLNEYFVVIVVLLPPAPFPFAVARARLHIGYVADHDRTRAGERQGGGEVSAVPRGAMTSLYLPSPYVTFPMLERPLYDRKVK